MATIKEVIAKVCPKAYADDGGKPKALSSYKLTSQSDITQLEPIYFWILDFLQDAGNDVTKVTDNFAASPGSGQFQDFSQRQATMMAKASEYMGAINQVTKSILNLIYDLKEFEIRLEQYERAKDKDKKKKEEGMLALKQVWLDNVDLKRGRGSIHQMANEMGFTTLREAFLIANEQKDIENMASKDGGNVINESVKRILIPRLSEFLMWKDISEKELSKRFAIEKTYLKSQVETLKLYTKWARPYLKSIEELRMKGFDKSPELVAAFSTSMFELTLMAKKKQKAPPAPFDDYKMKRDYYAIYVVNLEYRGHVGQKVTQKGDYGFGFGGRVDMTFDCYALNSDELKLVEKELANADISDGLSVLQDNTAETMKQLEDDIKHFVYDDVMPEKKNKKEDTKKEDDTNPFTALVSLFTFNWAKKDDKKKEIAEPKDIPKDNDIEKIVRDKTKDSAKEFLFAVYDVYKKAHGMASSPDKFES
ncbi:hypothetical protein KA107_00990 [Candidatus Pacearchaeota archaeon]|nr:hypothetical protein [Candidatus Pacearchaeota archaeon]